ncbi:neocarzinostatin apoprotein domain-containing protein [uncultured Corynebacterium sp.]|uniref:neocarzinostatin apoprotein domain-containing protein n=1 Tax=uncultured Corynebacterium sp. TaxID=159447 RepID=UPI0025E97EB4|nr:neocarzinostatin apoprotein domain-containing protein [uncultured Corynebacterium sp.]
MSDVHRRQATTTRTPIGRGVGMAALLGIAAAGILAPAAAPEALPAAGATPAQTLPNLGSLGDGLGGLLPGGLGGSSRTADSPQMTLSQAEGLTADSVITVSGAGYAANENIYVAQTIEKPASGYPETYGEAVKVTVGADGTFTAELPVDVVFGEVDCRSTQCHVATFMAFPKLADRSQDAWTPIHFGGGTTPGAPSAPAAAGGHGAASAPAAASGQSSPAANAGQGTSGASVASGTSTSGASVSLDKATGLNPSGDSIRVRGTGFSTSGHGIYVGIAQQDQFNTTDSSTFGEDTVWVSTSRGTLSPDGSFDVTVPVSAKFGSADCLVNHCAIYTFAAHGSSDRSQDTATPVSFAGGVEATSVASGTGGTGTGGTARGAGAGTATVGNTASTTSRGTTAASSSNASSSSASAPSVSLSTTSIAASGTTPITVTGRGFSTSGPGVYVGVAEKAKFSHVDASVFGSVNYVKTSDMSADGSFTTTVEVEPTFAAGNCVDNACALFSFAAHGSSDRSQDTTTDVTVTGSAADKDAAREKGKKEAEAKAAKDAAKESKSTGTNATEGEPVDEAEARLAAAGTPMNPLAAGGLGAIIGAALLGAGVFVGRRTRSDSPIEGPTL